LNWRNISDHSAFCPFFGQHFETFIHHPFGRTKVCPFPVLFYGFNQPLKSGFIISLNFFNTIKLVENYHAYIKLMKMNRLFIILWLISAVLNTAGAQKNELMQGTFIGRPCKLCYRAQTIKKFTGPPPASYA
jgi:hypothetical protein